MKVKNIMFSGFAAAILMGTAYADPVFQIASKAYVDQEISALSSSGGAVAEVAGDIGNMSSLSNDFDDSVDTIVDALNELKGDTDTNAESIQTINNSDAMNSGITAAKVANYDAHVADTTIHVTAADKTTWNGKQNALDANQMNAVNSGITAEKVAAYDALTSGDGSVAQQIDDALGDLGTHEGSTPGSTVTNTVKDVTDALDDRLDDVEDNIGDISDLSGFETQPTSVVAALNDLQSNKLNKPIPNECSATSQHCVLHMDNLGNLSWIDITSPYEN